MAVLGILHRKDYYLHNSWDIGHAKGNFRMRSFACLTTVLLVAIVAPAQHNILLQGNNRLALLAEDGSVRWEMDWPGVHDLHWMENGHILTVDRFRTVVEIDPVLKEVVWSYSSRTQNGNKGKPVEVHAVQPLANGHVMIAESGPARIIEVDREGNLLKEVKLKVDNPHPHRDTRLARKLDSGNYLVCHEGDGVIREYDGASGAVVWEYAVPLFDKPRADGHGPEAFGNQAFGVLRLDNGNTLIATGNGHSVIEVTPEKEVVWHLQQNDLPEITLAWVTTLDVRPNGNLILGNCHAGPGQPQLIEVTRPGKEVVWRLDQFDAFGNDASNAIVVPSELRF